MSTISSLATGTITSKIPVTLIQRQATALLPDQLKNLELQLVNKVEPSAIEYAGRSLGQWAGGLFSLGGAALLLPVPGFNLLSLPLVAYTGVSHVFSGVNFFRSIFKGITELK